MSEGFIIRPGFPDHLREQFGQIYFEAFAGKIGWPLGGTSTGPGIIAESLDPRFALTAISRDGTRALGIAGYKTHGGALVSRLEDRMRARFGGFSLRPSIPMRRSATTRFTPIRRRLICYVAS